MHKIKDMLMKELMKYEEKGNISMNSLDVIHKMTDTIKNIDKCKTDNILHRIRKVLIFFKSGCQF